MIIFFRFFRCAYRKFRAKTELWRYGKVLTFAERREIWRWKNYNGMAWEYKPSCIMTPKDIEIWRQLEPQLIEIIERLKRRGNENDLKQMK